VYVTRMTTPAAPEPSVPTAPEALRLVQELGMLVYNTHYHHWFSKTDEHDAQVAYFALVTGVLTRCPEIVFRMVKDDLTVNGVAVPADDRLAQNLRERMKALQVDNFAFMRGLGANSLAGLLEVLSAEATAIATTGGFTKALAGRKVANVSSRTIVYREVTEDEVVVARTEMDKASRVLDQSRDVRDRVTNVASALERIKGADESNEAVSALKEVAEDAQRLAELVMEAARAEKEEAEDAVRETLAGTLVACVRRAFDTLMQDEAAQTQKGKKDLQKRLRAFEQEMQEMLGKIDDTDQASCRQAVRQVIEDVDDELQIDTLAAEYLRRLKAIEKTEKRLQRYMQSKGDALPASELGARLIEGGIDPLRLRALADVGNAGADATPGGEGLAAVSGAAITQLATTLSRMEKLVTDLAAQPDAGHGQVLAGVVSQISTEVGQMAAGAAKRMAAIADEIQADAQAAEAAETAARKQGHSVQLSRKRLLDMLAEVVQELAQPLAVINCSVDMVRSQKLGELVESQQQMLTLVAESSERLKGLVAGLQRIVGVPATMSPDRALLDQVVGR
jgi:hypothetical protein